MSDFKPGLEGVVAFETEIAEPDKEGGALRYRGVDIEELVGRVSFGDAWGLLVDDSFTPGLAPAEPHVLPVHSGDVRVDVQSALPIIAPAYGMRPLLDISVEQARADLARTSVTALSFVAQSARGLGRPMVPLGRINEGRSITGRFMIRWQGEPDPQHVKAIDAYWVSAAEHGLNASTFTARVIASTGADVAAAMSGAIGATRYEAAKALEDAALAALQERRPDRPIETNVEFWAAVVLDFAQVPTHTMPAMFTCARTAGWAAHILEQKRTGRLVRPSARYTGPGTRAVTDVPGAAEVLDRQD